MKLNLRCILFLLKNYLENNEIKNDIINNKFSDIVIPSQKIENRDDINDIFIQIN